MVCGVGRRRCGRGRTAAVRADLSRVTRTLHHVAPYLTVPYSTVPYHTVSYAAGRTHDSEDLTLSLSKKAKGKESRCGKPAKMWKTLWKTCRGGEWGRCWAGWPRSGVVQDGWPGSGVVRDGWPGSGVVRELRRARWLAFLPREKTLDKLCKSILDWKQEITQEAARDRRRRRERDASTASGEQSSASSPRGEGLGLAQNLPNEKTCMEGWLPCTFRVRWGFRRGGPGLTQPEPDAAGAGRSRGWTRPKPDAAGACAGRGPCQTGLVSRRMGAAAGQLCWPWAG